MPSNGAVWSANKETLLSVLEIVNLVPSRPGISASEFIRVTPNKETLTFELTSEVCAKVTVKGNGEWPFKGRFFIDRRLLIPFLSVAKDIKSDAPFEFFKEDEGYLGVRHGRRKASFEKMADIQSGYGELPDIKGAEVKLSDDIKRFLECAATCASPDPATPELNCVYIHAGEKRSTVLSYNQIVMFCGSTSAKDRPTQSVAFPLFLIPFLSSEHLKRVTWSKKDVILHFDCGTIWQTVPLKAAKEFPCKQLIDIAKEKSPEVFVLECKSFSTMVSRLVLYLGAVRRQDWLLEITNRSKKKDMLDFEVRIPQGSFRERLKAKVNNEAELNEVWSLDTLFPIFNYFASKKDESISVHFDKKSPYHLVSGNVTIVVSRKQEEKKKSKQK